MGKTYRRLNKKQKRKLKNNRKFRQRNITSLNNQKKDKQDYEDYK